MSSLELLAHAPLQATLLSALFGLLVGSFLNVVIHRLPKMMEREWQANCAELNGEPAPEQPRYNLVAPRSRCPGCGALIAARDNVPVVSYLLLRGRCRHCRTRISPRYPLVETLTALLFAACVWHFGVTVQAGAALCLVAALVSLTFIDADTMLLPDQITLPLVWLGLLFNLRGTFAPLATAVIGAVAGYLCLWLVYWGFRLLTGKEGMGYGDFKLLAALGAWFGWTMLPAILLLSSLVGAVVMLCLIVFARRGRETPFPFGPYLAGAGLLALFLQAPIQALLFGVAV